MNTLPTETLRNYRAVARYFFSAGFYQNARLGAPFVVPGEVDFFPSWEIFKTELERTGSIPPPLTDKQETRK